MPMDEGYNTPNNVPQQNVPQQSGLSVPMLLQNLRQLTPMEKQMLAQAITPQIGEIIIKVFGDEIRPIVQPLMGQGGGQPVAQESSQPVVDPTRSPIANMRS